MVFPVNLTHLSEIKEQYNLSNHATYNEAHIDGQVESRSPDEEFQTDGQLSTHSLDEGSLVESRLACGDAVAAEVAEAILKDEVVRRLDRLGNVSDSAHYLQRTFLSDASLRAAALVSDWMEEAGMYTWMDAVGNVHGRVDGSHPDAPVLLLGSHLDTVVDAGRFDGALGVVTAVAAVKLFLTACGAAALPRPVEIIAFSDEEGMRFQSTFLGSRAIAGTISPAMLQMKDSNGVTIQEAIATLPATATPTTRTSAAGKRAAAAAPATAADGPADVRTARYLPESVWGYVEAHLEQGPVLESLEQPLGVVLGIAGQTRAEVTVEGEQGHAGTVPMRLRRDAVAGAAAAVVAVESVCLGILREEEEEEGLGGRDWSGGNSSSSSSGSEGGSGAGSGLVCTVGKVVAWPGESNVIAGSVAFTLDVRARSNGVRLAAVAGIEREIGRICSDRGLSCRFAVKHQADTVDCSPPLVSMLHQAAVTALTATTHHTILSSALAASHQTRIAAAVVGTDTAPAHDAAVASDAAGFQGATAGSSSGSKNTCEAAYGCRKHEGGEQGQREQQEEQGGQGQHVPRLVSGAGHDAMAMADLTQVAMLFVRCRGGVSHRPDEFVNPHDLHMASTAIFRLLILMP
ncbi:unnamed protein product [Closterium sp. NIES-65]|nr:unnamed protein product [Closterium sp. NIES-65]